MFRIAAFVLVIYTVLRFVLPLRAAWPAKAALSTLIAAAAFKQQFFTHIGGHFFSPELPKLVIEGYTAAFVALAVLFALTLCRDLSLALRSIARAANAWRTGSGMYYGVFASSGITAIKALQAALERGIDVSLANKESIVVGGPWVMPLVKRRGQLRPIDSEHSAVWQCLRDTENAEVSRVWLTASGGPFRSYTAEQMEKVTAAEALNHPVWKMGPKITIDSATLMNKSIECIEAMQLFGLPAEKVGALVHPKSQIHGVVEFIDGTAKLLLSQADMRLPAAAAIAWPRRLPLEAKGFAPVEPSAWDLNFSEIDESRFPCFALAREAGRRGDAYPALLVGADESAVEHFLNGEISYPCIARLISSVLEEYRGGAPSSLDAVALVEEGRRAADEKCKNFSGGMNS